MIRISKKSAENLRIGTISVCFFAVLMAGCAEPEPYPINEEDYRTWTSYMGDKARTHYSSLNQINVDNVQDLEVAWTFSTNDAIPDANTEIQNNPLIIDGILYATSPQLKLFALNAGTGEKIWMFDPFEGESPRARNRNRGINYWTDGDEQRLFYVAGSRLYSVDMKTGQAAEGFGENGSVNFALGLDRDELNIEITATSPGVIHNDLLIQGSTVFNRAPGHIRAFNVRTGEIEWVFRTVPHPGEYGFETWPPDAWTHVGNANSWAGMTLDEERGIVYVPTASPGHDFYGGERLGENLFGTSLIALDASTGERIWHFQFVRHDIWDRDLPAPPNLVTIRRDNQFIDAVVQVTKSGHLFIFDRETGEPLYPIEEIDAPPSDVPGEEAWPTQPLPVKPEPFSRQKMTEDDITDITPESHEAVLERFCEIRTAHPFDPPSKEGTLIFPGFDGGAEWGGAAVNPATGVLYINANEMPWIIKLVETGRGDGSPVSTAASIYALNCASCHGASLSGQPQGDYPSLLDIEERMSDDEIRDVIISGSGVMPPFGHLSDDEVESLVGYLKGVESETGEEVDLAETIEQRNHVPYTHTGYNRFLDPEGYPAVKPPWGTLNAIDLNTGEYLWRVPLGEFSDLTERGIPQTGTENYGGPVVTAGGLLFIGATQDEKFRAFDKITGVVLWEAKLPAGGYATPSTYEVNGKQYVVIAAGGGKMGTPSGDTFVAFSLPE
jgi:quinoprotein glucose dehydrogenase